MSHSERVCRVGSMALAPIATVLMLAAAGGVVFGIVSFLTCVLPEPSHVPDVHHSVIAPIIIMSIIGCVVVALIASTMYPYFYRHCRGAEFLAKCEALDAERAAISREYGEKLGDVDRRMHALVTSERDT